MAACEKRTHGTHPQGSAEAREQRGASWRHAHVVHRSHVASWSTKDFDNLSRQARNQHMRNERVDSAAGEPGTLENRSARTRQARLLLQLGRSVPLHDMKLGMPIASDYQDDENADDWVHPTQRVRHNRPEKPLKAYVHGRVLMIAPGHVCSRQAAPRCETGGAPCTTCGRLWS